MFDIEFHTAYGKVSESLIDEVRREILSLSHMNRDISRAEVTMKEDETMNPVENKICEIRITVYGDDLLLHSRTSSFRNSAHEAIKELKKLVKEQVKRKQEPPDEMTSTVKVE
jgi:mRNA-degrading endonuclease RelE of RelBE toxin-antitoxin system